MLPVPAAGDVSDSRFAVRHRLKYCAKLVGILTLHVTELPHLRKRREEKDKGKQRQRKENVKGRRRGSERANFWEPVCGVYCVG